MINGNKKIKKTQKRLVERQRSTEKNHNNKCQLLNENKNEKQSREQLKRIKMHSIRERKELSTFSPKLTKYKNKYSKNQNNALLKKERTEMRINTDTNITDWINRQNVWMENKKNKLNERIVIETMKKMEKCIFEPKINKVNKKIISNLKIESHKILEKPESYINYVRKSIQFRKNKSTSKNNEYPITKDAKSPYKGKNKIIKINKLNDYDYTKHQLTGRNYLLHNKCNSSYNNISINVTNKSFNAKDKEKTRRSIPLSKLKLTNLSEDELYKMVYLNEKDKIEKKLKDFTDKTEEMIFKGKEQIHFKKALEKLHITLININLDDSKNNEDNNNIFEKETKNSEN